MRDLQFLNPQYKLGIIPAAGSIGNVIKLPKQYIGQFQRREQEIYAYRSSKTTEREQLLAKVESLNASAGGQGEKVHIVQQGETLGSIARLYRTYISQLIVWNNLKDPDVTPGQKLVVFGSGDNTSSSQSEGVGEGSVKKKLVMHKVGKSETLSSIARKYGTSVRSLAELNNLGHRMKVVPGQRLKIEREVVTFEKPRYSARQSKSGKGSKGLKSHKGKKERAAHSTRRRRR